jgi:hypothetical protein
MAGFVAAGGGRAYNLRRVQVPPADSQNKPFGGHFSQRGRFMDDLLQQGITAYKAGKRDEARKFFITVVKQNPDNEHAWGWMYQVLNNDQEQIHLGYLEVQNELPKM